ncbi:MAG: hypothetical protein ACK5LO_17020 [Leucobacter sp.]
MAIALVLGTAQGAAAEAEVPVPPGQVVDPAAPESGGGSGGGDAGSGSGGETDGGAAGGGAESGEAGGVGDGVGTTSGDGPGGTGAEGAPADDGAAGGAGADPEPTEQPAADESGVAADAARTAPAKAGAAKTAAAKKKAPTLSAYAKKVNGAGLKRAGLESSSASTAFGDFKASKSQKPFVRIKGKQYSTGYLADTDTAKSYRAGVVAQLKRDGMKLRGTVKSPIGLGTMYAYSNSRFSCTVRGGEFACASTKKVKATLKKLKPLIKLYKRPGGSKSQKGWTFTAPDVSKSASKKYRAKYRKAIFGAVPLGGSGTGSHSVYFAKKLGSSWRLVEGSPMGLTCAAAERSANASRALAGESCLYKNYQLRKVRAR